MRVTKTDAELHTRGLCSGDPFRGGWELPFRQIPWALPFRVTRQQAHDAFLGWEGMRSRKLGQLQVHVVRPMHVYAAARPGAFALATADCA